MNLILTELLVMVCVTGFVWSIYMVGYMDGSKGEGPKPPLLLT